MIKTLVARSTRFALAAAVAAVVVLPSFATAALRINESFRYPNGNVVGQGGWQEHSGTPAQKPIQVSNTVVPGGSTISVITVQQGAGSGEDDNKRWFNAETATAKTYASFNFSVASGAVIGTATDYFAHFRPAPIDTIGFVARVHIGPGSDATHFTMGISTGSNTTTPLVMMPNSLLVGQTYKIVSAFSADSGKSQLWIDPTSESDPNAVSISTTVVGKLLESYAVRQASPTGATYNEVISDMKVGTTFSDVVTLPKELPSVGTWGLALLGVALALGGGLAVMSRRRTLMA